MTRSSFPGVLSLSLLLLLSLLVSPSQAAIDWPEPRLDRVVDGLTQPVYVTHAGDGSGRLFAVERRGRIRVVENGTLATTPFLDITSRVKSTGSEQGLLSVAFPPGYPTKGYFYVYYTAPRANDTSGSVITVSRINVSSDADVADANTESVIFTVDHPTFSNHNGGLLLFGPDGHLYAGTGDGGSGGDPPNNAQNPNVNLGKLLRLDVENGATTPEIFALGLRNPWRYAFDRVTGDLYIADVGQNAHEEVNHQAAPLAAGLNYGWRIMEGMHCYPASVTTCDQTGLTLPVAEYGRSDGCSVSGGFVYRGHTYARMAGMYFYGDYCSGNIWGLKRDSTGWVTNLVATTSYRISSFGEDDVGRLYITDLSGGAVYEVTDPNGPRLSNAFLPLIRRGAGL